MRFGLFLINRGIVKEEDVYEAVNIQRKRTAPIGKIALQKKKLTISQVNRILIAQIDTVKKFGEVAVDLGFLIPEDVEMLLRLQVEQRPRLGEILVEMGKLDEGQLQEELQRFAVIADQP